MTELRLVPAAVALWLIAVVVIGTDQWWVAIVLGLILVAGCFLLDHGQAVLVAVASTIGGLSAGIAQIQAARWDCGNQLHAVAISQGQPSTAGWLQQYSVAGYPASVPVFFDDPTTIPVGATVLLRGDPVSAEGIGLNHTLFFATEATIVTPPSGPDAVTGWIRQNFIQAVTSHTDGDAQMLLPGMVLGDTSLQDLATKQLFLDTGLAHLSAVSGANVAIVTTAAALVTAQCSPRVQGLAALLAVLGFVLLVGTEPSVLRAAVMGVIATIALLSATVRSPINSLALAVIGLLLWDISLAVNFGFVLSVVATAGIVVGYPGFYRWIARTRMPDIVAKALAIALAAQVVTMPIVGLLDHKVSVVSVLANILTAPVVAPITVVGLLAVVLGVLPGGLDELAGVVLNVVEPLADWIGFVARNCSRFPGAVITFNTNMAPLWALLIGLWIIYLLRTGRLLLLGAITIAVLCTPRTITTARPIDLTQLQSVVIASDTELAHLNPPPGTQLIIVNHPHKTSRSPPRPAITPSGIPIAYREPDGSLSIVMHTDGTITSR